ncbi:hypothetical protein [Photobacterium sanguinicancri]|uniref:hypothetical protein n=1 Tax=Photobacterium sanguinicancri TaxID=875932 RepID=UPI003D0C17F1
MICNHRALLLAGFFSLPVMATTSSQWEFAGTRYQVEGESPIYTVHAARKSHSTTKQIKTLCRRGLALPLRAEYENKLIANNLIEKPFSSWPVTNLSYELTDLSFFDVSKKQASCSARITDTGKASNLQATALSYAIAYYSTQQNSQLKTLLPYLMKEPQVSMDAASLITLVLSQQDQSKAQAYFDQYVDISKVKTDTITLWLAHWQKDLGDLGTSKQLITHCQSAACQHLSLQIDDAIALEEENSADDLSSYF